MHPSAIVDRKREKIQLDPVTPALLSEMVRRIVKAVDPDKVILFGSHARGTQREYSDLDLLVIKPGSYNRLDLMQQIDSLFWDMSVPTDVVVLTPDQVERELQLGNTFLRVQVLQRGRLLYERSSIHT